MLRAGRFRCSSTIRTIFLIIRLIPQPTGNSSYGRFRERRCPPEAGAPETENDPSPAMISAGLAAWYDHDEMFYEDDERMRFVWRAMWWVLNLEQSGSSTTARMHAEHETE
jgi:hypothetical protein